MFLFLGLSELAILAVGLFVGMKLDKWFGKNHRNLHAIYKHLDVHTQEEAIAKIDGKL